MKCPCEECLCIPICRHKIYVELVKCSLIKKYLIEPLIFYTRPAKRMLKVEKYLNPISWIPICQEDGVYIGCRKVD